jgi:hypothetical protein
MYKYYHPRPIVISLAGEKGLGLREKAAEYIKRNPNVTGAERGSIEEQGFGALAEIVIRNELGLPEITPDTHPVGYDIPLSSGVKVDVKCRGGTLPFQEKYMGNDGIPREAKHNLFARQLYDESLETDIYLMTHLETPKDRKLPGNKRQKKWTLYVCGWVSKDRVIREGVYIPRGSLTEQGKTWFTYRGQEVEFYNKNLNGLEKLEDLLKIENEDVEKDKKQKGSLNLTSVDAIRITYDLIGREVLSKRHLSFVKSQINLKKIVKPILHSNQYYHLMEWLKDAKKIGNTEIKKLQKILKKERFKGI